MRASFNGISYAMDPYGRMLAETDNGAGAGAVMYADVPVRGGRTPHARFGDWLGWMSVAAMLLFVARAALAGRSRRAE